MAPPYCTLAEVSFVRPFHLLMLGAFALTLFTSATLLFMIQPLVGKMMLPLLGGTPEVWNTCMVFFQAMLLGGYAYAHASTKWLGVRWQSVVHLSVLSLPLVLFAFVSPLEINEGMIGGGEASPVLNVLVVLLLSVGLPFFVVSTSAPLLQKWFSSTDHPSAADPYFLYGASNFGSMLSLIGYPLFIEPYLTLKFQRLDWGWGYAALVLCIAACVALLWLCPPGKKQEAEGPKTSPGSTTPPTNGTSTNPTSTPAPSSTAVTTGTSAEIVAGGRKSRKNRRESEQVSARPAAVVMAPAGPLQEAAILSASGPLAETDSIPLLRKLRWVLLGAVPVSLLMGVTTYMTTDIAAIPLLWIPPLALYLLTFIIVFASPRFQNLLIAIYLACNLIGAMYLLAPPAADSNLPDMTFIPWLLTLCLLVGCLMLVKLPTGEYVHKGMILALPLMMLLLVFVMLSDIGVPVYWKIILHLQAMFVATMVCHGELARDRPSTKHLTEFFMLMSLGGVVGGIFNALVSPIIFNSLAEYPIALVVSCLLLPPLLATLKGKKADGAIDISSEATTSPTSPAPASGSWLYNLLGGGLLLDLGMTAFFLVVGGLLIGVRLADGNFEIGTIDWISCGWMLAAVIGAVLFGVYRIVMRTWVGPWSDYPRQIVKALPTLLRLLILGTVTLFVVIGSIRFGVNIKRDLDAPMGNWFIGILYFIWSSAEVVLLLAVALVGLYVGLIGWRRPNLADPEFQKRREMGTRIMDGLLPAAIAILVIGLIQGTLTKTIQNRMISLADILSDMPILHLNVLQLKAILTFGVPVVCCYIFVERSRRFGLGVAALLMGAAVCSLLESDVLFQRRSFFGVLKVENRVTMKLRDGRRIPEFVALTHGTTLHGKQFGREYIEIISGSPEGSVVDEDQPLTYYHKTGPLGQVFQAYSPQRENDTTDGQGLPPVGVIGLGTGTTARYGQRGQHMTYYDIDRLVKRISWDNDKYFSYISDARKRGVIGIDVNELKLNDARLAIKREVAAGVPEDDRFGILVVDAFSSDAIPVHLITKEAVMLFQKRVKDDGLICYHISNRYLDLLPVLANLAKDPDIGLYGLYQHDAGDENEFPGKAASTWVVLCKSKQHLNKLQFQENNLKNLFVGQAKQPNLNVPMNKLPRTLSAAFPEVANNNATMLVLPNMVPGCNFLPQVAAIGFVASRMTEVPIWYELQRGKDDSVGVWTDDYASIPSVFTPLRRKKPGE